MYILITSINHDVVVKYKEEPVLDWSKPYLKSRLKTKGRVEFQLMDISLVLRRVRLSNITSWRCQSQTGEKVGKSHLSDTWHGCDRALLGSLSSSRLVFQMEPVGHTDTVQISEKLSLSFFVFSLVRLDHNYFNREEKRSLLCYFPCVVFSEWCVMLIIIQLSLLPPRVYLILSQMWLEDWAGNNSNHNNLVCPHIHTQTNSTTVTFTSTGRT